MALRGLAYRRHWLPSHDLPLPTVAVGNLTVGGSGKTPVAIWIARHYVRNGLKPGILLRGYGGDETQVHRRSVPEATVVADPDRVAGASRALAQGAQVLVLDDAFQRLDVRRDLNIAVVAAETTRAVRWPVPAGPWREGLEALERADAVIVTRKRASREAAEARGEEAAHGAELEHLFGRLHIERLQRPAVHHRLPHVLAMTERQCHDGIGHPAVRCGDEGDAR
jgi:tetraacyldisaccharide 4'-kinase